LSLLFAVLISTVNFQFDVFAKLRCTLRSANIDRIIEKKAADQTIIQLGLNNEKLIREREKVIKDTLKHIRTKQFSSQELQKLIQGYDKLDNRGEYVRFCAAVLYYLKQEYSVKKKSGL
ncbi:hypothetical protein Q5692_37575, partial [Microcoleus sp. C2C3]|uniref:hypothetical protein n=1 Tax=unclassified Microcoleus TaxID=2642155 RepID=UPI002FD023E6